MPKIDRHAPGSFCLIELATTDQEAAKTFYTALFRWGFADHAMGPGAAYTLFRLDDRDVASAYTLQKEMCAPPHWDVYISVESADQAAVRAGELGGAVIVAPFDVMDYGRIAVLRDPVGAVFCVWQPRSGIGIGLGGAAGTLCWADLSTPDPARAKQFFEGMFGWKITAGEHDPDYLHIKNGDSYIGGILPPRQPDAPPHWLAYFLVDNVEASTKKATELGARVYMPRIEVPEAGIFSVIADPQGATLALYEASARS